MLKIVLFILLFIYFFFWCKHGDGIPVLKIVMSHVHMSVISGVIFNKSSSEELSWMSRYGRLVKTIPKCKVA